MRNNLRPHAAVENPVGNYFPKLSAASLGGTSGQRSAGSELQLPILNVFYEIALFEGHSCSLPWYQEARDPQISSGCRP
jgi:hypothetical protein